jgi:hypothetical protein
VGVVLPVVPFVRVLPVVPVLAVFFDTWDGDAATNEAVLFAAGFVFFADPGLGDGDAFFAGGFDDDVEGVGATTTG